MFKSIFNTFANCFKIPELKSRIIFTLVVLAICRVAAMIPIPGLDGALQKYFDESAANQGRGRFAGHMQHVHGRRARAMRDRRARHHAIHQRHDYHPAAHRGCAALEQARPRRRGRPKLINTAVT